MLIRKPFAHGDDRIQKSNEQLSSVAYNALGRDPHAQPQPSIPKSALFDRKPNELDIDKWYNMEAP